MKHRMQLTLFNYCGTFEPKNIFAGGALMYNTVMRLGGIVLAE